MHPPLNHTGPEQVSPPPFTQPPNRPNGKRTAAFVLFGLAALSLVCALICWAIVAYLDVQFGLDGPGTGWFIMLALPIYLMVFILSRVLPVATAAFALIVLRSSLGGFGSAELPAPQAAAVAAMAGGLTDPLAFFIGAAAGLLLYVIGVPSATLGLGVYLPTYISSAMALEAGTRSPAAIISASHSRRVSIGSPPSSQPQPIRAREERRL